MNVQLPAPTGWIVVVRGYAARQWRRRLPLGGNRAVALNLLPGDVQDEIRRLEKQFGWKHGELIVSHLKDATVRVSAAFTLRVVS